MVLFPAYLRARLKPSAGNLNDDVKHKQGINMKRYHMVRRSSTHIIWQMKLLISIWILYFTHKMKESQAKQKSSSSGMFWSLPLETLLPWWDNYLPSLLSCLDFSVIEYLAFLSAKPSCNWLVKLVGVYSTSWHQLPFYCLTGSKNDCLFSLSAPGPCLLGYVLWS